MEYLYSAMLLHRAGKQITEEHMEKVLTAAGVNVDKARIKAVVTALKDVDIDKIIKEASIASAAPAQPAHAEKKEEKKAEKAEEKKTEEEAAAGLGALFG